MIDWIFIAILILIGLAIGTYIIIDNLHAWHIIDEWLGRKPTIKEEVGQSPPPKDIRIFFHHPERGKLPFYGKTDKADNKFDLLNKKLLPVAEAKYDHLKLAPRCIRTVLEKGQMDEIVFEIKEDTTYDQMKYLIESKDMQIKNLLIELRGLTKTIGEARVDMKKTERAAWDAEFKGRRTFYPQFRGKGRMPDMPPTDEGGDME